MTILYTIAFGLLVRIIDTLLTLGRDPRSLVITALVGIAATMLEKSSSGS